MAQGCVNGSKGALAILWDMGEVKKWGLGPKHVMQSGKGQGTGPLIWGRGDSEGQWEGHLGWCQLTDRFQWRCLKQDEREGSFS